MIFWILLIVGILSLGLSIYSSIHFIHLNEELDRDPREVEYLDYLTAGYGTFLLFPASLFFIIASIWLLIANH